VKFISHRGNIVGSNSAENKPDYIMAALLRDFDVEIDVWRVQAEWYLGHDEPRYLVDEIFLAQAGLWLHAKNYNALTALANISSPLNYFAHDRDPYVLTSRGYIWAFPWAIGKDLERTVCILEEEHTKAEFAQLRGCMGICSDYVAGWMEVLE